ncbi:hypothetical protein DICPUDRAFT_156595 [Dictyostelium purpureum]|uniref:Proteasome assembly chaperone 2 n=1 Tax=Dictyostelium purpureum TaxID=5786 RepID=F0ZWZ4_DICPU|nr:uncharacterized protein DICPUDRAFT_156595 [Dictyostelium purpureum]EGC31535.1 hypothetical protein DICPUDRAFT_156595 [Dictyostelium purpureum]|eukprot:XP_003291935.1 hypothetical protein DICPUDRAFT_156595 [Dictyostelium purpureum]
MPFFYKDKSNNNQISFKDNKIIWPSLTLGNIGQLTIDVLICSFEFKRVGFIVDENVIPIVGNDCYTVDGNNNNNNKGVLSTSIEVYQSSQFPLITLVQQRSPIIDGCFSKFSKPLLNWIKTEEFKEIIFISSSNANKRVDSQLFGPQIRYIKSNTTSKETIDKVNSNGIPEMELEIPSNEFGGELMHLSNRLTGLAKEIYLNTNSDSSNGPSFLCVNLFCSEGYNTVEALQMAYQIYILIKKDNDEPKPTFKTPNSWKLLQGPTYDQSLFF